MVCCKMIVLGKSIVPTQAASHQMELPLFPVVFVFTKKKKEHEEESLLRGRSMLTLVTGLSWGGLLCHDAFFYLSYYCKTLQFDMKTMAGIEAVYYI